MFLAIRHGAVGWLAIAAVVALATVVLHPATRSAERYLVRAGATPDLTQPPAPTTRGRPM
jgi:hypothetical protein